VKPVSKRERWMLKKLLSGLLQNYLVASTYGKEKNNERGKIHYRICQIIFEFLFLKDADKNTKAVESIHGIVSELITDNMDETIGFPVFEKTMDYYGLSEKLFDCIVVNLETIYERVKNDEISL